jgi:hypothetical protein
MKKGLSIVLAAMVLVGCSQVNIEKAEKSVTDVPQNVEKKVEQVAITKTEKISLAEQMPLSCPPSGETAQSRMSQIDGRYKGVSIEFYLDCADGPGFNSKHIFFAEQTSPENKQEKLFYYVFSSSGLEWQVKDGEIHTLAAKDDYLKKCEGFGVDDPMKVLDLTIDGKELKALKTPIAFKDACLGDFQDAKFELKNFSEGVLDLGGRKFEINLEKGEAKEI